MKKSATINTGRWGTKYLAELNTDMCDRYNNAEITVVSRVFLRQGNPPNGAASGNANDSDGVSNRVLRWTPARWAHWRRRFVAQTMAFSGKFWLVNNSGWGLYLDGGPVYFPNIWCKIRVELVSSAAAAHHAINVYRVPKGYTGFRPDFKLMSTSDLELRRTRKDSKGKWVRQRTAAHEFFHILGVRHIDHGEANCPSNTAGNARTCYGDSDEDMRTLMGAGMQIHEKMAEPWRRAAVQLTGKGAFNAGKDWKAMLRRHYPRTVPEFRRKAKVVAKPHRK